MRRWLPVFIVAFTGLTLLLLGAKVLLGERIEPEGTPAEKVEKVAPNLPAAAVENILEVPWAIDTEARIAEIAALRETRGTVLAGTTLARLSDDEEFDSAVAGITGDLPPRAASTRAEITKLLRHTAHEIDAHAYRYEGKRAYDIADELRACSQQMRESIRKIDGTGETGGYRFSAPPFTPAEISR